MSSPISVPLSSPSQAGKTISARKSSTPQPNIEQSISSLTNFMNANLVHQKELKANSMRISQISNEFAVLKTQYLVSFTLPPTTTTAVRAQMYSELRMLCARYELNLELRRQKLERQYQLLEEAVNAPAMMDSAQLGLAIDVQIEVARDLQGMQTEKKLKRELEVLVAVS
jgi:hypothetical protein